MSFNLASYLICPCDQLPLQQVDRQLVCAQGHSYDIAKQGHVNLLLANQKQSKDPGDSKSMVAARRRWLSQGWYQPIAQQLQTVLASLCADGSRPYCIADAGCGEGFYLQACSQILEASDAHFIGWDISKWAVQEAAKLYKNMAWLVASNRQPPVAPASVDVLICAFGFCDFEAFKSILKPQGRIILIDPQAQHLLQLRQVIYPEVRQREVVSIQKALELGFELQQQNPLQFTCQAVPQEALADLLVMTPHLYRAPVAGKQAAQALVSIDLTVDVLFRVLRLP